MLLEAAFVKCRLCWPSNLNNELTEVNIFCSSAYRSIGTKWQRPHYTVFWADVNVQLQLIKSRTDSFVMKILVVVSLWENDVLIKGVRCKASVGFYCKVTRGKQLIWLIEKRNIELICEGEVSGIWIDTKRPWKASRGPQERWTISQAAAAAVFLLFVLKAQGKMTGLSTLVSLLWWRVSAPYLLSVYMPPLLMWAICTDFTFHLLCCHGSLIHPP